MLFAVYAYCICILYVYCVTYLISNIKLMCTHIIYTYTYVCMHVLHITYLMCLSLICKTMIRVTCRDWRQSNIQVKCLTAGWSRVGTAKIHRWQDGLFFLFRKKHQKHQTDLILLPVYSKSPPIKKAGLVWHCHGFLVGHNWILNCGNCM